LIDKGDLLKVLRVLSGFDTHACPFLGVQFPQDDKPQFHRSSTFGFLQTINFDTAQPHIFASLMNLKDLLGVSSDAMDMGVDFFGKLKLESPDGVRLQIHTVRNDAAGFKPHYVGDPGRYRYAGNTFDGFDIRSFKALSAPPAMAEGRLLICTVAGVAIWTSDTINEITKTRGSNTLAIQPREAFLRFVAGGGVKEVLVSQQGYWLAEKDGLLCAMTMHSTPTNLLTVYQQPGTELTRFHAPRLLASLAHVASLSAETDRVELNPREGIVCRDKYSNPQVFPHGAQTNSWPKAAVFGRTAKFIVDALNQTNEEIGVLYSVPLRNATYRIVRGPIEVNFGLV